MSEFVVGEVYTRIPHGWRRKLADGDEYTYDTTPGPREIIDPEYDVSRLGPTFKAGLHPETLNPVPPLPKHENVPDRLESLERHIKGHVVSINALNQRISKSDEEAALNLVATDARLDRLSGMVSAVDNRIDHLSATVTDLLTLPGLATLNRAVVDINDRLDRFAIEIATKANAEGVKSALADRATVSVDLRQVHSRLNRIATALRLDIVDRGDALS